MKKKKLKTKKLNKILKKIPIRDVFKLDSDYILIAISAEGQFLYNFFFLLQTTS